MEPLRGLNRSLTRSRLCRVNLKGTKQNEGSTQQAVFMPEGRGHAVWTGVVRACVAQLGDICCFISGFLIAIPWLISTSTKREDTGAESDLPSVLSEPPFWGMSSQFFLIAINCGLGLTENFVDSSCPKISLACMIESEMILIIYLTLLIDLFVPVIYFPRGSEVNLLVMQETQVQSLGREDPLEKATAINSSILAWRIPWTEEPGVHGVQRGPWGRKELDTTEELTLSLSFLW